MEAAQALAKAPLLFCLKFLVTLIPCKYVILFLATNRNIRTDNMHNMRDALKRP